jgi:hypothetical protein
MSAVTGDTGVGNVVSLDKFIQSLPKLDVFDWFEILPLLALPSVGLPLGHPIQQTATDVFAVGKDFDATGAAECLKAFDDGHEFHAIVRCVRFAAGVFFFLSRWQMPHHKSPTTWARIPAARSVGK